MNINQKIAGTMLMTRLRQLLVAVLSVTFGISMYIFMNGFMAGVNNQQTDITFTSMPHIKIYNDLPFEVQSILPEPEESRSVLMVNNARNIPYTEGIINADAIKEDLSSLEVISGVTTQLNENVLSGTASPKSALPFQA